MTIDIVIQTRLDSHTNIKSRNSQIDFILANDNFSGYAKADCANFDSNYRKQGKGYWKLNSSVLSEDKYKLLI